MSDGTFLLSISGQLEYIETFADSGSDWHCKYEFVTGPDWKLIGGIEAGLSQICSVTTNGENVVLNLPIEVMLKSSNVYGWPQIALSVYKNMTLEGYGRCHIPLTPGVHTLNPFLSRPLTSTFLGYLASFFGYQPELVQPKMLATTAGNHLLRMTAVGHVMTTINVVTQGFTNLGYDVGHVK